MKMLQYCNIFIPKHTNSNNQKTKTKKQKQKKQMNRDRRTDKQILKNSQISEKGLSVIHIHCQINSACSPIRWSLSHPFAMHSCIFGENGLGWQKEHWFPQRKNIFWTWSTSPFNKMLTHKLMH